MLRKGTFLFLSVSCQVSRAISANIGSETSTVLEWLGVERKERPGILSLENKYWHLETYNINVMEEVIHGGCNAVLVSLSNINILAHKPINIQ